jgi:hypothetical protein
MKLKLDSLTVDSFEVGEDGLASVLQPTAEGGAERSQVCSLIQTCATCFTDCPCA